MERKRRKKGEAEGGRLEEEGGEERRSRGWRRGDKGGWTRWRGEAEDGEAAIAPHP